MLASMPRAEMRLAPSSAGVGGGVEEVAEAANSSSTVCRINIDGQQPEHGLLDAIKLYGATPSTFAPRHSAFRAPSASVTSDSVPERLRGCTRNALGSARVSSSLTAVAFAIHFVARSYAQVIL